MFLDDMDTSMPGSQPSDDGTVAGGAEAPAADKDEEMDGDEDTEGQM